jgi:SAM-dependent methyltransferase
VEGERLLEPCVWRDVGAYVRRFADERGALCSRIHPADEMYRYERSIPYRSREAAAIGYFATGHQIFRTVREIAEWRFGRFAGVRSFLDFASGYGRLTRFLVRDLPPERITVAEIDPAAVRFQQSVLGVNGLVSGADPEALRFPRLFDMVFAASFFSHLPSLSFGPWLRRLHAAVSPGGLLVFSVHDMHLLPDAETDERAGIVFRPTSETERLDPETYGTSYVTPAFVREAANQAGLDGDRLLAFSRGLCGLQDLFVLLRPPSPDRPDLQVSPCPRGTCDVSRIQDGVVSLEGWVEGGAGERPPDVRLHLREVLAASLPGDAAAGSGSRRRWSFAFPLTAVEPDDVVRVEAESARGLTSILAVGSMRPYLPAAAV